jgi:hypothetical protein
MTHRERMEAIAKEFHFDLSDTYTRILCAAFAWQDEAEELRTSHEEY